MPENRSRSSALAAEIIRTIMNKRGVVGEEAQEEFLAPNPRLAYDPFLLRNMEAGVDLLLHAISDRRKIVIYGDYDCDGVTATALLMKVLRTVTDRVTYYIPSRMEEGYGLHCDAIKAIKDQGGEVIVTVDCGSVSAKEAEYAASLGMDMVITDHHEVRDVVAPGIVINPKVPGDTYPFRGLAGVGVAYKLALALSKRIEIPRRVITEVLELVAVGTIGDIMPLLDENRSLVKYGLQLMRGGCCNLGLKTLLRMTETSCEHLLAEDISFQVVPRINAAGRLGDASLGVKALLAETPEEADDYCRRLMEINEKRREMQKDAYQRLLASAEEEAEFGDFLLVDAKGEHEGILGIVAGKLKEHFRRPVALVTENEGNLKGTSRSIDGLDIFKLLSKHRDMFSAFGGHAKACGFTMKPEDLEELRFSLNEEVALLEEENPTLFDKKYNFDMELEPGDVTPELVQALSVLEPCGEKNERPVALLRSVHMDHWNFLGSGTSYARFRIDKNGRAVDCILFQDALEVHALWEKGLPVDVYGKITVNRWNGRERLQLEVRDVLPAGAANA